MNGRGKLVLVVDDDPACRFAIERVLRGAGHTVHSAETREAALALVRRYAYDIALLDNSLSPGVRGHEGLDILCAIRSQSRATKVVMITGHGSPLVKTAALEGGATCYLEKPVPLAQILDEMSRLGVTCGGVHRRTLFCSQRSITRIIFCSGPIVEGTVPVGQNSPAG